MGKGQVRQVYIITVKFWNNCRDTCNGGYNIAMTDHNPLLYNTHVRAHL